MGFADQPRWITSWNQPRALTGNQLLSLQSGQTALREAIAQAAADLRSRSGTKFLVVVTDGKDTTGRGLANAELVRLCREADVTLHAVGLENSDLDSRLLSELATATGGRFLKASRSSELVSTFQRLQGELIPPQYLIEIPENAPKSGPLRLTIGRGDSALTLDVPRAAQ